jgi:hypothetical protein
MSGQGQVLGTSTTATGVAVLPNTGGNTLLTILAWLTIAAGVTVLTSSVVRRLVARNLR